MYEKQIKIKKSKSNETKKNRKIEKSKSKSKHSSSGSRSNKSSHKKVKNFLIKIYSVKKKKFSSDENLKISHSKKSYFK